MIFLSSSCCARGVTSKIRPRRMNIYQQIDTCLNELSSFQSNGLTYMLVSMRRLWIFEQTLCRTWQCIRVFIASFHWLNWLQPLLLTFMIRKFRLRYRHYANTPNFSPEIYHAEQKMPLKM